MGVGKVAGYDHIPEDFPHDAGVVGHLAGVICGLGGFFCPIPFGWKFKATGLWATCKLLLAILLVVCLTGMHLVDP